METKGTTKIKHNWDNIKNSTDKYKVTAFTYKTFIYPCGYSYCRTNCYGCPYGKKHF